MLMSKRVNKILKRRISQDVVTNHDNEHNTVT